MSARAFVCLAKTDSADKSGKLDEIRSSMHIHVTCSINLIIDKIFISKTEVREFISRNVQINHFIFVKKKLLALFTLLIVLTHLKLSVFYLYTLK